MTHRLKVFPVFFSALLDGSKSFELRKNDRSFCVGDDLELMEYSNYVYSGRYVMRSISYILSDVPELGLDPDFVILGFKQ